MSNSGGYPAKQVAAAIKAATRGRGRRNRAEIASDALGDAVTKYRDLFTGRELDDIASIRQALEDIAEGRRGTAR